MPVIQALRALEILDSRGRPTVVLVRAGGRGRGHGQRAVGATTGTAEALELRDGDPPRYRGLGCRKAVANIERRDSGARWRARRFADQAALDAAPARARRHAEQGAPGRQRDPGRLAGLRPRLRRRRRAARSTPHFADMAGADAAPLPRPTINLFSGGKHAGGQVPIQDVLVVPLRADTAGRRAGAGRSRSTSAPPNLLHEQYGMRLLPADEGGLAPAVPGCRGDARADAVEAIDAAGLRAGPDVALAVDVASSHFYRGRALSPGRATPSTAPA